MGIVHKLLQRRDLERQGLVMDLTKSKLEDVSDVDLVPKLATEDNQFTAEHIVQLCRFLAEKSTSKKTIHKRLISSPNRCKHHQIRNQRESNNSNKVDTVEHKHNHQQQQQQHDPSLNPQNFPLHPTTTETHRTQVLTNKLSVNTAISAVSPRSLNSTDKHKNLQEKRNILLKIRHQIFERKRQRQMGEQQPWRPW